MVTCYPVAGKAKSLNICRAFADGCQGSVALAAPKLEPGPCFFYGVDASNAHLWNEAKADLRRDYYYCDNAFFDSTRQTYFRVARNRLQHSGRGKSDGKRFAALGIAIKPWRTMGEREHIVLCPQSDHFMRFVIGYDGCWQVDMLDRLKHLLPRKFTMLPMVMVRKWSPDKGALAATLPDDLVNAYALVTYSSAAAVTAVLSGIPVVVQGQSAAAPMSGTLEQIEALPMPEREEWCGVLADAQWTLAEFREGVAWRVLND